MVQSFQKAGEGVYVCVRVRVCVCMYVPGTEPSWQGWNDPW